MSSAEKKTLLHNLLQDRKRKKGVKTGKKDRASVSDAKGKGKGKGKGQQIETSSDDDEESESE